jgi:hypothetical protein
VARPKYATPDTQRAEYEARGGEVTSIGDEIDSAYSQGYSEGAKRRRASSSSSTTVYSGGKVYEESEGFAAPRGAPVAFRAPAGGPVPGVTAPMVAELVIITADSIVNEHRAPLPSRLIAVFLVFGVLGAAQRTNAAKAAQVFGWSLVLATFYNSARPGRPPGAIGALNAVGDFMSGKWARKGSVGASSSSSAGAPQPPAVGKGAAGRPPVVNGRQRLPGGRSRS